MFLQEHQGYIDLFPAVPDDWKKISFKRLRSYQGVLVSAEWKDGKIKKVVFESKRNVCVNLLNSFDGEVLTVKHAKTDKQIQVARGAITELELRRGKTVIIVKE